MGSKTKIMVFRMRELIYTGIFITLGIILVILMIRSEERRVGKECM